MSQLPNFLTAVDASKAYNGKTTTLPELFIDKILQDPSLAGAHPANDAQSIFKVRKSLNAESINSERFVLIKT